jgi:hypothetical protein
MSEIAIDLYSDESDLSKKMEDVLKKYRVPYVKHCELVSECDTVLERPYLTIGDPEGTPLGPVSDIRGIDIAMRNLVLPGGELIDPRINRVSNSPKNR